MKRTLLVGSLALILSGMANAADVQIVNADPPGSGLNDPTPRAPEGLNPGTTVGEQRLIAYQFAADLWGGTLQSTIPVLVQGSFASLDCDATSGVLGSSSTNYIFRDFANAPLAATWYHSALADSISGTNLTDEVGPDIPDLISQFNSDLGQPDCLAGSGWYYGLDGLTPAGQISFVDVVMHELAHGLGFSGFYSLTTGAPFSGFPDVFSSFVYDDVTSKNWVAMTNTERKNAAIGNGLVFTGAETVAQTPLVLDELLALQATGTLTATLEYGTADFGAPATSDNINGDVVLADDGTGTTSDACEPLVNAAQISGHIALVDRGTCAFALKSTHAQDAGATAIVIANNIAGPPPGMTGGDETNVIPTISVTQDAGIAIKAALPGVHLALATVAGELAGADSAGRPELYAPSVLALGSSFSHFDVDMSPNALMEPAINDSLSADVYVDLTPAVFADLGWTLNPDTVSLVGCDTTVPFVDVGGLILGSSFTAKAEMCVEQTSNFSEFAACNTPFSKTFKGLVTHDQHTHIKTCKDMTSYRDFYESLLP